jgi:D-psicose/D-tagatose/L-ribulose 3-epimerase
VAAGAGASVFSAAVIGVGGAEAIDPGERVSRLQYAGECLHHTGEHAAGCGVRFCVEVLNRYESNLVNTAREACELMGYAAHPHVGIHLDCFHMNVEELHWGDAIRLTGPALFHLHASESDRGVPGRGHVNWPEVRAALDDIGYDGLAVIESFHPAGRLAPLARFWRPFAQSPDTLAREGLAFLRQALVDGASP